MRPTRRELLLAVVAGGGSVAGCLGDGDGRGGTTGTSTATETEESLRLARQGVPPTICEEPISEDSGIDAILDPAFDADWSGYEVGLEYGTLDDDDVVVGLTDGDRARAYPISVLYHHEIVNDDFGGPVIVTFCPLCNSGVVADRVVGGRAATFRVTGLLWQPPGLKTAVREDRGEVFGVDASGDGVSVRNAGNLVMYDDRTRSYWSQILAKAICGPETGTSLSIRPSTTATWGEWRRRRPETTVLLPPPHSGLDGA